MVEKAEYNDDDDIYKDRSIMSLKIKIVFSFIYKLKIFKPVDELYSVG